MFGVGSDASLDAQQVGQNVVLGVYAAAVEALFGQAVEPEIKILVPILAAEFAGGHFCQPGFQFVGYQIVYGAVFNFAVCGGVHGAGSVKPLGFGQFRRWEKASDNINFHFF